MYNLTFQHTHIHLWKCRHCQDDEHSYHPLRASLCSVVTPTPHLPLLPGDIPVCFLAAPVSVHFLELYVNEKKVGAFFLSVFFHLARLFLDSSMLFRSILFSPQWLKDLCRIGINFGHYFSQIFFKLTPFLRLHIYILVTQILCCLKFLHISQFILALSF